MRKKLLLCSLFFAPLFSAPLCIGDVTPKSPCAGWESLQQLGSLMPERIWEQEFDIQIDCSAFQKKIEEWLPSDETSCLLGHTNRYFLKSSMSGENSRLFDRYEEFEWSPFWKNPAKLDEFRRLEMKIKGKAK